MDINDKNIVKDEKNIYELNHVDELDSLVTPCYIFDIATLYTQIEKMKMIHPEIFTRFEKWLSDYWNFIRKEQNYNDVLFDIEDEKDYCSAIIYYISGMTDNYAIQAYEKIIKFE